MKMVGYIIEERPDARSNWLAIESCIENPYRTLAEAKLDAAHVYNPHLYYATIPQWRIVKVYHKVVETHSRVRL